MIGEKVDRRELEEYLAVLLQTGKFKDYCPNGLQVEGRAGIATLVTGVTASVALIEAAIAARADAVLVHHGYFWRGEDPRVIGQRRQRLSRLLRHDINLFAYHLPLDAHDEFGNNAQLALRLGVSPEARFGEQDIGMIGSWSGTLGELVDRVAKRLGRHPQVIGDADRPVCRVAWCTGAAQGMFESAIAAGADAYISGEISEPTVHTARESGVAYIGAGHHATERYGIAALGRHLAERFGLEHEFIEIDNPV